jgi:hypothetical protein
MSKKHVLYCSGSGICTVHVPVPVLFLFWYPHCRSSDTPSHPVPEGSTVNRYLHSHLVPTLHVIQYPVLHVTSTQFIRYQSLPHPVLQVIRYQKVLQVISVLTLHVIRYHIHHTHTHTPYHLVLKPLNTSSTRMFQKPFWYQLLQSSGTNINNNPVLEIIQNFGKLLEENRGHGFCPEPRLHAQ